MLDGSRFIDQSHCRFAAHELESPVGRDYTDHMKHLGREVRDWAVLDEKCEERAVVGPDRVG